MAYLPHAFLASSGQLHCVVEGARISNDTGKPSGLGRYMVLVDLRIIGAPGDERLQNVRYFSSLTLPTGTRTVVFDDIIETELGNSTHEQVSNQVDTALNGRLVSPISVGGRWIVR